MNINIKYLIYVIINGLMVSSQNEGLSGVNSSYLVDDVQIENKQERNNNYNYSSTETSFISYNDPLQSELDVKMNSTIPKCCSKIEENILNCKSPGGYFHIKNYENVLSTYNLIPEIKEEVLLYFSDEDVPYLGKDCSLKVGDQYYDDRSLLKENNIYLFNETTSLVVTNENPKCSFKIFYKISVQYTASAQLLDLKGTIEAPIDPDGLQNYRPMTTFVWYIQPLLENCFLELNIIKFDLGSSTDEEISPDTESNTNQYDYLSIGLDYNGTDLLVDYYTFFGKWNDPATEILPLCFAKITFSSKMHFQNATGFRIDYKTKDAVITDDNEPPSRLCAWLDINGAAIRHDESMEQIFPHVKMSIVEMANNYLELNNFGRNVSENSVTIYEVGTCSIFYCQIKCMSFYFSVDARNNENEPIFTTEILNDIITNTLIITTVTHFEVCHRILYVNWSFPIFFLLLVIISSFGLIAISICEQESNYKQKRKENLRFLISDWNTAWRRQSFSDINISSASSQTPFVKKRFYFPGFGNRRKTKAAEYPNYEVTEFKVFKSKPVDENFLGLNEATSNSMATNPVQFSNYGFNDDIEIFNKYGTLNITESVNKDTPNIHAEQSFYDANPFKYNMIKDKNLPQM